MGIGSIVFGPRLDINQIIRESGPQNVWPWAKPKKKPMHVYLLIYDESAGHGHYDIVGMYASQALAEAKLDELEPLEGMFFKMRELYRIEEHDVLESLQPATVAE